MIFKIVFAFQIPNHKMQRVMADSLEKEISFSFRARFTEATDDDIRRYLKSRAGDTLKSYNSQYKRLRAFAVKIGKSFEEWTTMDALKLLNFLEKSAISAPSLSIISAVTALLAEVKETSNVLDDKVIRKSIRSMMKASNLRNDKPKLRRRAMNLKDIEILNDKLDDVTITIPERQVILGTIFSFLAVRRSREVRLLKWADVELDVKNKTITAKLESHKTDKFAKGHVFTIDGGGNIDLVDRINEYRQMLPTNTKYLFPKFSKRNEKSKIQRKLIDVPIADTTYRNIMKSFSSWGVEPGLLPHSPRIGAVTQATIKDQGSTVKKAGLWTSDAVEVYDRSAAAFKVSKLLNDLC